VLKGAIDIGTNSTRLLIAEVEKGSISKEILRLTKITRLGEGVSASCILKDAAIERTLKALRDYRDILDKYKVEEVSAIATSAARDAGNVGILLSKASVNCDINIDVIPGALEAKLCFMGATSDPLLQGNTDEYLVIDIGGGSVELIYGEKRKIKGTYSFDIGCVRLTEMFLHDDPPTKNSIVELGEFVKDKLCAAITKDVIEDISGNAIAIAVAGTSTSLVAIDLKLRTYDPNIIHGAAMTRGRVDELLKKLSRARLSELRRVIGLQPERADVIIAGAAIQAEIMNYFGFNEIIVSERDILDGLILNHINA